MLFQLTERKLALLAPVRRSSQQTGLKSPWPSQQTGPVTIQLQPCHGYAPSGSALVLAHAQRALTCPLPFLCFVLCFETGLRVAQADSKLYMLAKDDLEARILMPPAPDDWDQVPQHPAFARSLLIACVPPQNGGSTKLDMSWICAPLYGRARPTEALGHRPWLGTK